MSDNQTAKPHIRDVKEAGIKPASTPSGNFFAENQKSLAVIGGAIVLLIVLYFAYQKFYIGPKEIEAQNQMQAAEKYWGGKNWDKAIKGDGQYPGFEKIIADYDNTKAANLAYYYLGVAYLNKGEFNKAIENLTSYSGKDNIIAAEALGSTGDAYVELKQYDKAITYFQKAADKGDNAFHTPFYLKKLGLVYEAKNDFKSAAEQYQKIKDEYPASTEGQTIDAYIARATTKE